MEWDGPLPLYPRDFYRPPPNAIASLEPVLGSSHARRPPRPTLFYVAFRRLSLFCKWIGCFPAQISTSSSQLEFSWYSLATVVSSSVPIFTLSILSWGHLKEPVVLVEIVAHLPISLGIRLMFFSEIPSLIELVQRLDQLEDIDLFQDIDSKMPTKVKAIIAVVGISSVAHFHSGLKVENLAFADFIAAPMAICGFLYALCFHNHCLWVRLERAVARLADGVPPREALIEHHRIAHIRLIRCVRLIDQVFGNWLALIYIFFSINLVNECCKMTYGITRLSGSIHTFMAFALLTYVYYPAVIIQRFQEKNKIILRHLFQMSLNPSSDRELFQIGFFQRQVQMNKATVSAAGLADVNKEIIPKALSLFASFFIAAIQLMPQIQAVFNAWEKEEQ